MLYEILGSFDVIKDWLRLFGKMLKTVKRGAYARRLTKERETHQNKMA